MHPVTIIIDDFKIGGIQRIALDQAYALSEKNIKTNIIVLNEQPAHGVPTFLHTEENLIKNLQVNIIFLKESKLNQLKNLYHHIKVSNPKLIICHSLTGTVLCRLTKTLLRSKLVIVTTVHQLLSMSAPAQRVRRVFYSQFTDILFAYSNAVKEDWDYRRRHNPLMWLISASKTIAVCRNGVYLQRIVLNESNFIKSNNEINRLIFVNRLTAWKGLPTALRVIQSKEFSEVSLLIMTPDDPGELLLYVEPEKRNKIVSVVGKSISQVEFYPDDIHIYPATYGSGSRFIESVSINVLEMACFGVKSFVTEHGVDTWPELVCYGIIYEVDWSDLPSAISTILKNALPLEVSTVNKVRQLIDVTNNLNKIFASAGLELPFAKPKGKF
jgi:glycosyltransferase involved in cell wall biosynthesis